MKPALNSFAVKSFAAIAVSVSRVGHDCARAGRERRTGDNHAAF